MQNPSKNLGGQVGVLAILLGETMLLAAGGNRDMIRLIEQRLDRYAEADPDAAEIVLLIRRAIQAGKFGVGPGTPPVVM